MTPPEAATGAAPSWPTLLEGMPARQELPSPRDVAPVVPTLPPAASGAGTPLERWACLLAGLVTRYGASDGPVVVTVAAENAFTPVIVQLAGEATADDALAAWRSASSQHPAALAPAEFAALAVEAPSCAQVLLRVDDTPWPETLPRPALELLLRQELPGVLSAGEPHSVVDAHLAELADTWVDATPLSRARLLSADVDAAVRRDGEGPAQQLDRRTVWALVQESIAAFPEAEALRDARRSLTYRRLGDEVEGLAAALARAGVRRGALVGICVDRSATMVVAMLAVHRCGAAYVPIDPSYPAERIAMMVEDAALSALVTESALLDRVVEPDLPRVLVDDIPPPVGNELDACEPGTPEDLAYVIFTSGSTGRPKGVMIGQRALVNFVRSIAASPGMAQSDRLLAVTTLSFDIAELELLVPLVVGACVVVADRDTTLAPGSLAARLEQERVTVMQATPATWRMLVDDGWAGRPGMRVLCGGEALPQSLADELVPRCRELWNMYGPTETTIWSMIGRVGAVGGPLTLGKPIHNTSVVVADRWGNVAPDGIAGELLIGGAGLADGYLGRPDLTADRFVASTAAGGERVYRTGDLVRRGPQGGIEFIGRIDGQVKVRGFRVELAEVEAALESHDAVARAVAVVRPDARSGTHHLLAYVVAKDAAAAELDNAALRRHVADHLPEYMVPSAVTLLPEFPLTLNGKIDRKALPDPPARSEADGHSVPPRTALESRIQAIWERVLGISPIGVTEDVFDLGSNSLLTARLYAGVRQELDADLPPSAAFRARTVAELAALVEQLRADGPEAQRPASLVPIRPTGTSRPLFLVHGGAGTVLLFEPLARRLPDHQPVYALQAAGLYGDRPPHTRLTDMASSYIAELREVQPRGPYRLGGYCFGALVAFEMASRLEASGEQVELLVSFNGPSPSYLLQYKPLFDGQGALTDETGRRVRGDTASVRPAAAYRRWRSGDSVTALAAAIARAVRRRAQWKAQLARRRMRVAAAVRFGRPLPDGLREAAVFQHLAAAAQDRYRPGRTRAGMTVVAGEGLYHRADLGWSDHVDGDVEVVTVAGEQRTPRTSMRAEFVGPIADAIAERLAALDAAGR